MQSTTMQAQSIATNTLLMPNIPLCFFENPTALETLRAKFNEFGAIYAFVAMKGFRRFMIVYEETLCAKNARDALDTQWLVWTEQPSSTTMGGLIVNEVRILSAVQPGSITKHMRIRLYYGQHNPINPDPSTLRLKVPHSEKNFLISPPGAPAEDWEQVKESPPNTAVLASDLTHAVAELSDDDLDDLENFTLDSGPANAPKSQPLLKIVPTRPEEHNGLDDLPTITVQDWDGQTNTSSPSTSSFPKRRLEPTPRPPIQSS
ncbi:Calcipressin-domain-containing protein [Dichotomocladium elegans]|nr:Calcipressin-domain-containing protein [Dichotomocladium elegans]